MIRKQKAGFKKIIFEKEEGIAVIRFHRLKKGKR
jgi:hypothetical protein